MSELQSISHNHIWMRCSVIIGMLRCSVIRCSVADLMRLKGKTTKVAEIINKAICSKCGCSEVPEYRIIYRGASEAAMLGAVGRDGTD